MRRSISAFTAERQKKEEVKRLGKRWHKQTQAGGPRAKGGHGTVTMVTQMPDRLPPPRMSRSRVNGSGRASGANLASGKEVDLGHGAGVISVVSGPASGSSVEVAVSEKAGPFGRSGSDGGRAGSPKANNAMQEICKLKIKAIPAVDARPTNERNQHNVDVEAASPGCRLGLGRWFATGPIGVEGKVGARACLAGMGVPGPLPTGSSNCRG